MPDQPTRRQKMFALIEAFQQSNLSCIDFCNQEHIPLSRFHYWQKKYRTQHTEQVGSFIPVKVGKGARFISVEAPVMLQYPNGVSLQLPAGTPLATIRTLLTLA